MKRVNFINVDLDIGYRKKADGTIELLEISVVHPSVSNYKTINHDKALYDAGMRALHDGMAGDVKDTRTHRILLRKEEPEDCESCYLKNDCNRLFHYYNCNAK